MWLAAVVASVERFAYKGVASNLVTYLTDQVKLGTSAAAKSVNNWCGVTSMLPLVGAFLADSYWDRYSTILGSSYVYLAVSSPSLTPPCRKELRPTRLCSQFVDRGCGACWI